MTRIAGGYQNMDMDEWIRHASQGGGGTVGLSMSPGVGVGNAWNVSGAGPFATIGHGIHAVDVPQTWPGWDAQASAQAQAQVNMPFNTQAQQGRQVRSLLFLFFVFRRFDGFFVFSTRHDLAD